MRLLWAKALDDRRTAIVIDSGAQQLLGGVAVMRSFEVTHHGRLDSIGQRQGYGTLNMSFVWEWSRVVTSPSEFEEGREWERREIEKPIPMLEQKNEP